jgi:hypothetical protein
LAREREARKCRRSSDKADRKNSNGNREVQGSNTSENGRTQAVTSENFEYGVTVPVAPGQGVENILAIGADYSYPADCNYPAVQAVTKKSMPTIPTLSSEGSNDSRPLWSSYQFPSTFILNGEPEEASPESPKLQRTGSPEGTRGLVSPGLVCPGNPSSGVREVALPGSINASASNIVESTLTTAYEYPSSLEGFGHRTKPARVPVARPRMVAHTNAPREMPVRDSKQAEREGFANEADGYSAASSTQG